MDVVQLNKQQLLLMEKILEKVMNVTAMLDRMEQNCKKMQLSLAYEEKAAAVEKRMAVSPEVVLKEVPLPSLPLNPSPSPQRKKISITTCKALSLSYLYVFSKRKPPKQTVVPKDFRLFYPSLMVKSRQGYMDGCRQKAEMNKKGMKELHLGKTSLVKQVQWPTQHKNTLKSCYGLWTFDPGIRTVAAVATVTNKRLLGLVTTCRPIAGHYITFDGQIWFYTMTEHFGSVDALRLLAVKPTQHELASWEAYLKRKEKDIRRRENEVAALPMILCFHWLGVNCTSFIGGDAGIAISKTTGMVLLQMELRGKDACIVIEDADLDLVAANVIKRVFSYGGQRCTTIKTILVMEYVADTLVEKVKARVAKLTVGPPEEDCDITPVLQVFDIFGACYATIVFIPSFHNYRIWFFLGLGMTTSTAWYLTIAIQGMHGCANFALNMLDKMRRRIFCAGRGALKGPMIIGGLHYMFKQNFEDDQSLVSILRSSKQITIILSDCLTEMRETLCYEIYLNNSWAVFNMSDELLERVLHPENVIFSILIVVMIKDGEDLYTMSCVDTETEANSGLQVVGTLISAPQLFLILILREVMRWEGINLLKIWKYHWIKKQILWPFDRGKGKDVVEMLSARFTFVFSTLETKVFARGWIDEGGNLQCSYHSWSFNGCGSSVAKTVADKGGVSAIIFKSQVTICVVLINSKNRISFQSLFGLSFRHCKEI